MRAHSWRATIIPIVGILLVAIWCWRRAASDNTGGRLAPADGPTPPRMDANPKPVLSGQTAPPTLNRGGQVGDEPGGGPWSCDVTGRLLSSPGNTPFDAAGWTVAVTGEGLEVGVELPVDEVGNFAGRVALPAESARLSFIGRGGSIGMVTTLVTRRVLAGCRVGVVLFPLRGGTVLARVVDSRGVGLQGARLGLMERPRKATHPLPTWQGEALRPAAQVVGCDAEGRARIPVRPGHVRLWVVGLDGSRGASTQLDVEEGAVVDAGDLREPSDPLVLRGRIMDGATGSPVPGAWVVLDDQVIHWRDDLQPISQISSDAEGLFQIHGLSVDALPMRAAVGSADHEVQDVVFASAGDLQIELRPRPTLRVRLVGVDGRSPPDATEMMESARLYVARRGGLSSPAAGSHADAGPYYWVRDAMMHSITVEVRPGDAPGEVIVRPPFAGEYEVRLSLPGLRQSTARAELAVGEVKVLALAVPSAQPTIVRIGVAPGSPADRPTLNCELTWLTADGEPLASAGSFKLASDVEEQDLALWRPELARLLRATPTRPAGPYRAATLVIDTRPDTKTILQVAMDPSARVELQLTYRGSPIPLGHAPIWCVPGDAQGPERTGLTVYTDESGRGATRLVPGRWKALSGKRFGEAKWVSFDVSMGGGPVVLLPTEP